MYLFKASSVTTVQPTTASRSFSDQSEYIVMSCFLIITILGITGSFKKELQTSSFPELYSYESTVEPL